MTPPGIEFATFRRVASSDVNGEKRRSNEITGFVHLKQAQHFCPSLLGKEISSLTEEHVFEMLGCLWRREAHQIAVYRSIIFGRYKDFIGNIIM